MWEMFLYENTYYSYKVVYKVIGKAKTEKAFFYKVGGLVKTIILFITLWASRVLLQVNSEFNSFK